MKILITGASSFLGSSLADKLSHTHEVVVLEHTQRINAVHAGKISGSMENILEWEHALDGIHTIIHLAGITHARDESQYAKINADGTRDLAHAAKKHGVQHIIFASTRAQGDKCGAYGASKKQAETYLQESGIPYTIFRIGEAYDEAFTGKEGIAGLSRLIRQSFFVPYMSDHRALLAPIHIEDVQNAFIAALDSPQAVDKTYVLCGTETLSMKTIARRLASQKKMSRIYIPIPACVARAGFFVLSRLLGKGAPDQMDRLLCPKESMSMNLSTDLGIHPRLFLK